MADDFGLCIGIEGEADFKAALREINQSFKVLGSEMQLIIYPLQGMHRLVPILKQTVC